MLRVNQYRQTVVIRKSRENTVPGHHRTSCGGALGAMTPGQRASHRAPRPGFCGRRSARSRGLPQSSATCAASARTILPRPSRSPRPSAPAVPRLIHRRQRQIDACDGLLVPAAQFGTDERSPVASDGAVAGVAEALAHKRAPYAGDCPRRHAGARQRSGEGETRQRRHDDIERDGWIQPVGRRVGQRADDPVPIPECPRPAVAEDQRRGAGAATGGYRPLVPYDQSSFPTSGDHRVEARRRRRSSSSASATYTTNGRTE
jgi:hypothetical protein